MTGSDALADENATALARLDARVDGIAQDVGKLTHTVDRYVEKTDQRFEQTDAKANASMQRVDDKLSAILVATGAEAKVVVPAIANSGAGDWIRQNLATIAVAAVGGFLAYVNTNIQSSINDLKLTSRDNVAAIASTSAAVAKVAADSSKSLTDFETVVAKTLSDRSAATSIEIKSAIAPAIPRAELELEFRNQEADIGKKVDKDVLAADEKRYDEAILRFSKDVVSREEHAEHWKQDADRFQSMGGRIEELVKSSATASVLQEQVREQGNRLTELQRSIAASLQGRPRYLEPINGPDNQAPPK